MAKRAITRRESLSHFCRRLQMCSQQRIFSSSSSSSSPPDDEPPSALLRKIFDKSTRHSTVTFDKERIDIEAAILRKEIQNVRGTDYEPLQIVHEDLHFLFVFKPCSVAGHSSSHAGGNMMQRVRQHFDLHIPHYRFRPKIMTPLPKNTSGIMVFAKNHLAQTHLEEQLDSQHFAKGHWGASGLNRLFLGITAGVPEKKSAKLLGRMHVGKRNKRKMVYRPGNSKNAKTAATNYRVLATSPNGPKPLALLSLLDKTSQQHQLRAVTAHLDCPLVGDQLYGGPPAPKSTNGLMLHLAYVGFRGMTPDAPDYHVVMPPQWPVLQSIGDEVQNAVGTVLTQAQHGHFPLPDRAVIRAEAAKDDDARMASVKAKAIARARALDPDFDATDFDDLPEEMELFEDSHTPARRSNPFEASHTPRRTSRRTPTQQSPTKPPPPPPPPSSPSAAPPSPSAVVPTSQQDIPTHSDSQPPSSSSAEPPAVQVSDKVRQRFNF